ncbi:hypothetical protein ACHAWF_000979 [Thalassiosira exigua]
MTQRRPPRAPAGIRPASMSLSAMKPTPIQRNKVPATRGFSQKVAAANQRTICNATNVGRISLRALLTMDQSFEVPMFQRRYCWTSTQWEQLLSDATASERSGTRGPHSLGRLTCTNVPAGARSCILDGQQRFTTATILLAAIRDAIARLESDFTVAESINGMLFTDVESLSIWGSEDGGLAEGMELPFAKLVPSFCDRESYYAAILPDRESSIPLGAAARQSEPGGTLTKSSTVSRERVCTNCTGWCWTGSACSTFRSISIVGPETVPTI